MPAECSPPEKMFWVYVSLWIANFFSPLLYSGVTTILPSIALDFHSSAATLSLIVMLFAYSQGYVGIIGGRLSDLFGLRRMMILGFIICFITLIGLFLSPNLLSLTLCRLFQGIGTALLICTSTAIAVNITPLYRRGTILGLLSSASYLGTSLGPIIAGAIATYLSWRYLFIFLLVPNVVGFLLFRSSLRLEWCTLDGEQFNTKGAIMLGLGSGAVSVGAGLMSLYFNLVWLVPIGFVLLGVFVYMQKHTKYPIINMDIFTEVKSFSLGLTSMMINFGGTTAFVYFSTMYFQQVRGFTPIAAGFFLLFKSLAQFSVAPLSGRLADKVHPEYIIILGLILCTASLVGTAYLDQHSSMYYIYATLLMSGVGIAIYHSPCTVASLRDVPKKEMSVASSIIASARSMGILGSQIIISLAISHYVGNKAVNPETIPAFLQSMKFSFLFLSSLNVVCILIYAKLALRIFKNDRKDKTA